MRRKSDIYETVSVVEAGLKYSKAVTAAYIPFISLLDVGAKSRACWSHLTQISSSSHSNLFFEMVKFNYTAAKPPQIILSSKPTVLLNTCEDTISDH